jgi:TIR domain
MVTQTRAQQSEPADLDYGVASIKSGPHKGRIGTYDNDEGNDAVVYFGHPLFAPRYHLIPRRYLTSVTAEDLMRRIDEIFRHAGPGVRASLKPCEHVELLAELALVQDEMSDRLFEARFSNSDAAHDVFISHAHQDKPFARLLALDLASAGHRPWLDEWEIHAGESIATKISEGIGNCSFLVIVLSEHAVRSNWVEREWQAKYWEEVRTGRVQVIPALIQDCEIPPLLKPKKYADFRAEHRNGLNEILFAIDNV